VEVKLSDTTRNPSFLAGKLSILEHFWTYSGDNMFILVLDDDGDFSIEDLNPAQVCSFSFPNTCKGVKLKSLLSPESCQSVEARYRHCLTQNEPYTYDEAFEHEGQLRYFSTMLIPMVDPADGRSRIFGIAREITQLMEVKNSLAAVNENLEEVIAARTFELQKSNEKLKEQAKILEEQANRDPLTKIGNRRYFFNKAEEIFQTSQKDRPPVSLIYLDLDDFKQINDQHGHTIGDAVLAAFTGRISSSIRHDEIFARFGGEEFVILLPTVDKMTAQKKAQKILTSISEAPFKIDELLLEITASIGYATVGAGRNYSLDKLLSFGDKALYNAKKNGKNRIETYPRPNKKTPPSDRA